MAGTVLGLTLANEKIASAKQVNQVLVFRWVASASVRWHAFIKIESLTSCEQLRSTSTSPVHSAIEHSFYADFSPLVLFAQPLHPARVLGRHRYARVVGMDISAAWCYGMDMASFKSPVFAEAPQPFELVLKVRDYECDMDHVVNNAVYFNYLEHARHEFLETKNLKFGELSKRGISLVVTRIEIDYKGSLHSGDSFVVRTNLQRGGRIRFLFNQSIHRVSDSRLMLSAIVTGTALNSRGRPEFPAELEKAFD